MDQENKKMEIISIQMTQEETAELQRFCVEHQITLENIVDQFLRWCVREPETVKVWFEQNKDLL